MSHSELFTTSSEPSDLRIDEFDDLIINGYSINKFEDNKIVIILYSSAVNLVMRKFRNHILYLFFSFPYGRVQL